ncbi:hypothetical protein BC832DRAFT_601289 [Gaertneriomyces semiglobifer]|nr:hypothetical protein BC832DRAFT_601289 [Gaertneriomyces semiglobifer]
MLLKSSLIIAPLLATVCAAPLDVGLMKKSILERYSMELFGIQTPLATSAPRTNGAYRTPSQSAGDQVLLAEGLTAKYVTRQMANTADQLAFWTEEGDDWAFFCIESDPVVVEPKGGSFSKVIDKMNPSVQAVRLRDGEVKTFLRGMSTCDGLRATPWGTIIATEETTNGGVYELFSPFTLPQGATVVDRKRGTVVDAQGNPVANIKKQTALPGIAWEGIHIDKSGVLYGGDELRPGSGVPDTDGGALFKFVPSKPRTASSPITSLGESPLSAGTVYAFTASCVDPSSDSFPQFGQGCETGVGAWVQIPDPTKARELAFKLGATGYYRPEDLEADPLYKGEGVRICFTSTGNADAAIYGEVFCVVDEKLVTDGVVRKHDRDYASFRGKIATGTATSFISGTTQFSAVDNLSFQPQSGNLAVIEDATSGDVWICLPDGQDDDHESDGCIRILSVKDSSAEPTGFTFLPSGTAALLSIQHSNDKLMPLVDGYPTDDILLIEGFKMPSKSV